LIKRVPKNLRELTFNVGVVFVLYCIISVIRIVEFFIIKHSATDYFNAGGFETFVIISYQLLFLLLTYFLVLMINKRLLSEISKQEEKFSKAFHSVPYVITITSLIDGKVIEVNEGFHRITNFTIEDVKGETTIGLNLWVNPQDREWVVNTINSGGKVKEVEFEFKKKTGELMIGQLSSEIIYINDEKCIISVINDITDSKRAELELKNSKELLKRFATHLQNVQEEEKILLANQLDNELAQILVALKMDVGLVKQKILTGSGSEMSEDLFIRLEKVQNLIGNSIKTTLNMMNDLRNEVLYLMGFEEAVKLFSIEFYKKYNIICIFESNILSVKINQNTSTSLFRIFQIAMSNVAQHAHATEVKVLLSCKDDKLILEINDNGKGLDQIHITNPSTNGLIFMKERALLLNGELIVTNLPNKGTSIRVEIPYSNQN
jgi:PAS domain S-box-containing protein